MKGRVREFFLGPERELAQRDVEPLEGTNMSLFNSVIPNFWQTTYGTSPWFATPDLSERVWVANRCIQLNAQQIAAMPVTFHGVSEPAWISNPDPTWYPNGVSDAMFAVVRSLYGWGFACLFVTAYYADGYPQFWTVLDPAAINISTVEGRRVYKAGEVVLDARRIIQIDRNPSSAAHGTPALRAFAQQGYAALAAADQSLSVSAGGIPAYYLAAQKKITDDQAEAVQLKWAERTATRGGLPPVLGPEIVPTEMSFNPSDLALLDTQEFNARVIAAAFGVPAVLLNIPMAGGLTYQNPAMLGEMWWRFELRTTSKRIADALTAQALPRGQFVTFEAEDTFAPIGPDSESDDPQLSNVANATPAQQSPSPLSVVGG